MKLNKENLTKNVKTVTGVAGIACTKLGVNHLVGLACQGSKIDKVLDKASEKLQKNEKEFGLKEEDIYYTPSEK